MNRKNISIETFETNAFSVWAKNWFLLTAGDFKANHFNTMTVAWGSFGTMWNLPFVQVVVRPTRYTYEFMEKYNNFTLSAFSKEHQSSLTYLGTHSGRDKDKIKESHLTPMASQKISAPCFQEANLVIEAEKIYWQDFNNTHFLDPIIETKYPQKDYHRVYFGKIVSLSQD